MDDTDIDGSEINDQLVLIGGESGAGKSASLMNIPNQKEWICMNCESGKRLPFKNDFQQAKITDPLQVYEGFDFARENPGDVKGIIIDTLTFLMDMYESQYVIGSSNTMKAWGDYGQFFKNLMQRYIAPSNLQVIILAHTKRDLDETSGKWFTQVPVKGALKNQGIEAYFSTVVSAKKIELKHIKDADPDLLHITPRDESVGFKHVFQTQLTKETVGERIRSPMGLFEPSQTYMDNDAHLLLHHLSRYYGG